jgi:hypothetical protein
MAIALVFTSLVTSSFAAAGTPHMIVVGEEMPSLYAGKDNVLKFTVKNNAGSSAKNIILKMDLEADENTPFYLNSISSQNIVKSLSAYSKKEVEFNVSVSKFAEEKIYPIKLKYTYANRDNQSFTQEDIIYVKVKNLNGTRDINIVAEGNYALVGGSNAEVEFTIKNDTSADMKNVKLVLSGLSNGEISLYQDTNTRVVDLIKAEEDVKVKYNLFANGALEYGNYKLEGLLTYSDTEGKSYSEKKEIFVLIDGENSGSVFPNIETKNISFSKDTVDTEEDFELNFDIENIGNYKAENVKVEVKLEEGMFNKTSNISFVRELGAGEKKALKYTLSTKSDAERKTYNVEIQTTYEKKIGTNVKNYTTRQYAAVYVDGDNNSATTPKIIIDKYKLTPRIVRAGENFTLDLSVLNTSSAKDIRNAKVFVTINETGSDTGGNVFTPVESSNTFYIDKIAKKQTSAKTLKMYTIPDAKQKTYEIAINFEYEDNNGKQYTAKELVGIPVVQQTKIKMEEPSIASESYLNQRTSLNMDFYNVGKVKVSNLLVKTEGDFDIKDGNYFVGNFEPGNSDYYQVNITPTKLGMNKGQVIFSYDDIAGEHVEITKDFEFNVIEMPQIDNEFGPMDGNRFEPEMPMEEAKDNKLPIAAGIVVLVIIGIVIKKKRSKRN